MIKKKILVIDDSETVRAHVVQVLGQAGYEVLEAPDGILGAFAIRGRADLSLVICDVNMPRMDGLQMLEVLKGQCPNLPVLMLTTESRLDKLERAKKARGQGLDHQALQTQLARRRGHEAHRLLNALLTTDRSVFFS